MEVKDDWAQKGRPVQEKVRRLLMLSLIGQQKRRGQTSNVTFTDSHSRTHINANPPSPHSIYEILPFSCQLHFGSHRPTKSRAPPPFFFPLIHTGADHWSADQMLLSLAASSTWHWRQQTTTILLTSSIQRPSGITVRMTELRSCITLWLCGELWAVCANSFLFLHKQPTQNLTKERS